MRFRVGDQPVAPLGRLRTYVCGITPYATTHLGHAFTFAWIDTLARVMDHVGAHMEVCRNVTDVDDDLFREAESRGEPWQLLANQWLYQFEDDMRKLNVRRPAFEPLARDYINEVIFMVLALIDSDAAYQRGGTVYFRGAGMAERAGMSEADAIAAHDAAHGSAEGPQKEHPLDAVLWQPSKEREPAWASPFGDGRPGWHIECAAMATSILGLAIDLHAGGEDLAFPHHTYESAIAEAATGVAPYSRSWMHMGTVSVNDAKMAKSTGNLVYLRDLYEDWEPAAVRLMLVDRPWGEPWDYESALLDASAERLDALRGAASVAGGRDASTGEVARLMVEGQESSAALDLAIAEKGESARLASRLLGLT
jgi:L-cysteine:1D-myo-inositol 2-amino-2-deoxy-alpha-D-glucopyranoside ligase